MHSLKMLIILLCATTIPFAYGYGKIVGGNDIDIELSPHTASLQYIYDITGILHHCGASIISEKYLLTSALCNPELNINNLYARVGSTYYNRGGQVLKVGSFIPHPEYKFHTLEYDISIVTFSLGQQIILGTYSAIIKLTPFIDHPVNGMVSVTGWGVTEENGKVSESLKEVILPIFNYDKCKETYSYLTPRHICIGGKVANNSACNGDAGSPAFHLGVQIGVVSGGISCHLPSPGLYARIHSVRSWITCVTGVV